MNARHRATLSQHFQALSLPLSETYLNRLLTQLPVSSLETLKTLVAQHFLVSDIRDSLDSRKGLPEVNFDGTTIIQDNVVQVLDCIEVGFSISQQLDALEQLEESRKPLSRRLIRDPGAEDDREGDGTQQGSESEGIRKKMCKLVLEDAKGQSLYGIESVAIPEVSVTMEIGAKMILRHVSVVYGVAVLTPAKIDWIGGSHGKEAQKKSLKEDLQKRLSEVPAISASDRQRAQQEQDQGQAADEEDCQFDIDGEDQPQQASRLRGRGTRGRARSARHGPRARGSRFTSGRGRGR